MAADSFTPASSTGSKASERRRSRRRGLPGLFVALEAATDSELCWAGNAIDVNGDGLGLALPPEVQEDSEVLLTFHLDGVDYQRVPAVVLRRDEGIGAVRFTEWPDGLRLALVTYLLEH